MTREGSSRTWLADFFNLSLSLFFFFVLAHFFTGRASWLTLALRGSSKPPAPWPGTPGRQTGQRRVPIPCSPSRGCQATAALQTRPLPPTLVIDNLPPTPPQQEGEKRRGGKEGPKFRKQKFFFLSWVVKSFFLFSFEQQSLKKSGG